MKFSTLVFIYLIGWIGCFVVGMQFEAWRWRKRVRRDIDRAYQRGWNSGRNFMGTIRERKLDVDSAVRILTDEDRPNPRGDW